MYTTIQRNSRIQSNKKINIQYKNNYYKERSNSNKNKEPLNKSNRKDFNSFIENEFQLSDLETKDYNLLKETAYKLYELNTRMKNKISYLNSQMKKMQEDYLNDKKQILEELDKIAKNYKFYSDYYKNMQINSELAEIQEALAIYKQNTKYLIGSYLDTFKSIYNTIVEKRFKSSVFYELKDKMLDCLIKYKKVSNDFEYDFAEDFDKIFSNYSMIKELKSYKTNRTLKDKHLELFNSNINEKKDLNLINNVPIMNSDYNIDKFERKLKYSENVLNRNQERILSKSINDCLNSYNIQENNCKQEYQYDNQINPYNYSYGEYNPELDNLGSDYGSFGLILEDFTDQNQINFFFNEKVEIISIRDGICNARKINGQEGILPCEILQFI